MPMPVFRKTRHWLTARATDAALALAPRLHPRTLDHIGAWLGHLGQRAPHLARNVRANMQAAGVVPPEPLPAYFAEIGNHFAGALHALRCARRAPSRGASGELLEIARDRVELDASVELIARRCAEGRGVIVVGPHIVNYLLNLTRLNAEFPLTVYLRHSRDPHRLAAKQRWYQASGVSWISEPPHASGPLGRLGRMAAALRTGGTLFITPDLPQKRGEGVPVTLFGRQVHLPPGAAILAERTGAPLILLTATPAAGGQQLVASDPFTDDVASRGRRDRRALIVARMQCFAQAFECWARAHPQLWYLWGDKRWTRVFRDDPRFVTPTPTAASERSAVNNLAEAV